MVKFKTFFGEALGMFPKTKVPTGVEAALREPITPAEKAKMDRERKIIAKYKEKRGNVYPNGKYDFQLVDGFKALMANAWRALRKPGQEEDTAYSVLLLGDPGIGKSQVIRDTAKKLTDLENKKVPSFLPDGQQVKREFIKWNDTSNEQKKEIMENPEKYYVFLDLRTAYLTTAGLEGLPVPEEQRISKARFFKSLPQQFIAYITRPKAAGVLFLDEVNQASREVQSTLYQVINDRVFKDVPIAPRILVLAAANLGTDNPVETMGAALSTRFVGAVLVPDPDAWIDWATNKGINPIIIDYVRTDPENTFFKYLSTPVEGGQWPNPRAIVRFNAMFQVEYDEYEELKAENPEKARAFQFREKIAKFANNSCGPEWGEGFAVYLQQHTDIDLEKLAASGEAYKKVPAVTKIQASSKLINQLYMEIDDAITSSEKTAQVGSPPMLTYPVDEAKLDANLKTVVKTIMLNNSQDANEMILKKLKARMPEFCLILLNYLVKDDEFFKILTKIEKEMPSRVEQI